MPDGHPLESRVGPVDFMQQVAIGGGIRVLVDPIEAADR
jgi:hypothetical protein